MFVTQKIKITIKKTLNCKIPYINMPIKSIAIKILKTNNLQTKDKKQVKVYNSKLHLRLNIIISLSLKAEKINLVNLSKIKIYSFL